MYVIQPRSHRRFTINLYSHPLIVVLFQCIALVRTRDEDAAAAIRYIYRVEVISIRRIFKESPGCLGDVTIGDCMPNCERILSGTNRTSRLNFDRFPAPAHNQCNMLPIIVRLPSSVHPYVAKTNTHDHHVPRKQEEHQSYRP